MASGTAALREFRKSLRSSEALLKLEKRHFHDPPQPNEADAVEALRGGASVLMVAAFEAFVAALMVECVGRLELKGHRLNFDSLPDGMKEYSVFTTLRDAINGPRFGPKGAPVSRLPAIEVASAQVLKRSVHARVFGPQGVNPSPSALAEHLKRLGMKDGFRALEAEFRTQWSKPVHATYVSDTLEEVVNRRHRVAHTAAALRLSRADLTEGVKFLRALAPVLDRVVRSEVRQIAATARRP